MHYSCAGCIPLVYLDNGLVNTQEIAFLVSLFFFLFGCPIPHTPSPSYLHYTSLDNNYNNNNIVQTLAPATTKLRLVCGTELNSDKLSPTLNNHKDKEKDKDKE